MSHDPEILIPGHLPPAALAGLDPAAQEKLEKIAHHVQQRAPAVQRVPV